MLVLTAKRDDRIRIGDDIEILVIYTADSRVRIGIEAPKTLRIERKPKTAEPGHGGGAGQSPGPVESADRRPPPDMSPVLGGVPSSADADTGAGPMARASAAGHEDSRPGQGPASGTPPADRPPPDRL